MTKTQRAKVVELLRLAATLEFYEEDCHGSFLRSASIQLSASPTTQELARRACSGVCGNGTSRSIQLAAAKRVEGGYWP